MDSLFVRFLVIVLASIIVANAVAFTVVAEEHRWPLLGALLLLLPIVASGVYFASRTVTRQLARLIADADLLGRQSPEPPRPIVGPSEVRAVARAYDSAQDRMTQCVGSRVRMLAAISHDMKAPITRMRLRVESLSDRAERDKLTHDLEEMAAMMGSALRLLKELGDDESTEAIDMNELIDGLRTEFTEMGRCVAVRGEARGPYVGRGRALKRCLANLIDNAVKFGDYASVTLEDGHALRVQIADCGPGIPQEDLERVFEPFYRVDSRATREAAGAGLGLAIARDIVLGHGGRLTLRNRKTRGLVAEVVLPRSG